MFDVSKMNEQEKQTLHNVQLWIAKLKEYINDNNANFDEVIDSKGNLAEEEFARACDCLRATAMLRGAQHVLAMLGLPEK